MIDYDLANCLPSTGLRTLWVFIQLGLTPIVLNSYHCPHFTDKDTDTERFIDLPKVTQPVGEVVEIPESEPKSLAQESKLFTITPYDFLEV